MVLPNLAMCKIVQDINNVYIYLYGRGGQLFLSGLGLGAIKINVNSDFFLFFIFYLEPVIKKFSFYKYIPNGKSDGPCFE